MLCVAAFPPAAEAQDSFIDFAFDQSFSSSDPLRSPGGFSASTGTIAVWGPVDFHATVRSVSDGGDDLHQDGADAPAACVPGHPELAHGAIDHLSTGARFTHDRAWASPLRHT